MSRQDQATEGSATAIQSGRDTTMIIQQGMSIDALKTIIAQLRDDLFLPSYAQVARDIVDQRVLDLEHRLLERFSKDEETRREAFADPDFQAAVITAQRAHARAGDDEMRDVLVELIAKRSAEPQRSRLSLSLNQAIEKAAALTHEEFSALTVCFLLKRCQLPPITYRHLVAELKEFVVPFVEDLPATDGVFAYLEAHGCSSLSMVGTELSNIMLDTYSGLVTEGITEEEWEASFDAEIRDKIKSSGIAVLKHSDGRLRLAVANKRSFERLAASAGLALEMQNIWALFDSKRWSAEKLVSQLTSDIPEMEKIFRVWKSSRLANANLTPIGVALAHANLMRVCPSFDAKLAIWIS